MQFNYLSGNRSGSHYVRQQPALCCSSPRCLVLSWHLFFFFKKEPPSLISTSTSSWYSDLDFWFTLIFFCKQIKWKFDELISFIFPLVPVGLHEKVQKCCFHLAKFSQNQGFAHPELFSHPMDVSKDCVWLEPRIPKRALHDFFFSFFVCPQRFRSQDVDKVLYHRAQDKQPWGVKRKPGGIFKKTSPEWGEDAVTTSPFLGQQKSYSSIQCMKDAWCLRAHAPGNGCVIACRVGSPRMHRNDSEWVSEPGWRLVFGMRGGIVHLLFIQDRSGLTKTIGRVCRETCLNKGGPLLPQINDPVDLTDVLTFPLEATRWFSPQISSCLFQSAPLAGQSLLYEVKIFQPRLDGSTQKISRRNFCLRFPHKRIPDD